MTQKPVVIPSDLGARVLAMRAHLVEYLGPNPAPQDVERVVLQILGPHPTREELATFRRFMTIDPAQLEPRSKP